VSKTPKVLYIMGTARSGSTILGIMLAGGKDIFGAGELTSLVQDGFIENKLCSCGKPCHQCEVWGQVLPNLGFDKTVLNLWAGLQKKLDWHDGFLRQLFGLVGTNERNRYRLLNRQLLHIIREKTGCNVVLDSSKYAGRALALTRIVGAEMKIICLTRSPAGLMSSFQRVNKDEQLPKGTMAALAYYLATLASLWMGSLLIGRRQVYRLRYKSLIADPQGVLQDIAQWSGIDLTEPQQRLGQQKSFDVGHLVTGNRLRKMGSVRFDPGMGEAAPVGSDARLSIILMNCWRWVLRF